MKSKKEILIIVLFFVITLQFSYLFLGKQIEGFLFSLIKGTSFIEVLSESGIKQFPYQAGAAWADYDNDNDLDLFLAGQYTMLYRNDSGFFSDVTQGSNLAITQRTRAGVFSDYDNDGCLDLYIASDQQDLLYNNNCDGTFTNVTDKSGLITEGYRGRSVTFIDYDNDGYLDIYVANYGDTVGMPANEYTSEPNILYHNKGNGTFANVSKTVGITGYSDCSSPPRGIKIDGLFKQSHQAVWFDYNDDGLIDVYIGTDHGVSPLYKNMGNGTFKDVTHETGLCIVASGMGVAVGDYDNDLDFDIYLTNTGANLFWNNNSGTFNDVAKLNKTSDFKSLGWGAGFFDYDNDGDLDMYVANGIILVLTIMEDEDNYGDNMIDRLFENLGTGEFKEVAEEKGIFGNAAKEGLAIGDYNNDGFEDVFVASSFKFDELNSRFYKNSGNGNHWITIKLQGTKSNRDGIGAKITVKSGGKSQLRQVDSGSSFLSQNSLWKTFGLGKNKVVEELEVKWPSGTVTKLHNINSDQLITVTEN